MSQTLPDRADVRQLRNQAKDLLRSILAGDAAAVATAREHDPSLNLTHARLADAQRVLARSYGFPSWPKLIEAAETPGLIDQFRRCIQSHDAPGLAQLLKNHRRLRKHLDDPIFSFDTPAVVALAGRPDSEELLRTLVQYGANPNVRSKWWAGSFSALDLAKPNNAAVLVELGAEYDVWSASAHGKLDVLRAILDADPNKVNAPGGDGMQPLHFASTPETAEFLISRGADLEAKDVDHEGTPTQHQAARPEVLNVLLRHGAKPDIFTAVALDDAELAKRILAEDPGSLEYRIDQPPFACTKSDGGHIYGYVFSRGSTALVEAAKRGCANVLRVLEKESAPAQRLLSSALSGDAERVRTLLKRDPEIRKSLSEEDAAIVCEVAGAGNLEVLNLLLEAGVDPTTPGMDGGTALHVAAWFGQAEAVKMLLGKVPLEARDPVHGSTPLGWAAHGAQHCWRPGGDYIRTVELLVEAGASATVPANSGGTSMLDQAGNREDVKQVLRKAIELP